MSDLPIFINTRPTQYPPYQLVGVMEHCVPLLAFIQKNIDRHQLDKLKNGHYNAIVFVSPVAVDCFVQRFDPSHLPCDLPIIAVGQATKIALKNNKLTAICPPANAENNEGMLALPQIQALIGTPNTAVLMCKGVGGRTVFAKHLQDNGVVVDGLDLYERVIPNDLTDHLKNALKSIEQSPNAQRFVLISSEQSFEHWRMGLSALNLNLHELDVVYLCLGKRLTTLVQRFGRRVKCLDNLNKHTLINALTANDDL